MKFSAVSALRHAQDIPSLSPLDAARGDPELVEGSRDAISAFNRRVMRFSAIFASSRLRSAVFPTSSGAVIVVIRRERRHLERAGTVRVDPGRRPDPILPHQRAEARQQR